MTDKEFDDFIKNKVKDHIAPVPAGMWDGILAKSDSVFDNFIKEKIGNHFTSVSATAWDNILFKKEKKRRAFFWWKAASVATILLCSSLFLLRDDLRAPHTQPTLGASENHTPGAEANKPVSNAEKNHTNTSVNIDKNLPPVQAGSKNTLPQASATENAATAGNTGAIVKDKHSGNKNLIKQDFSFSNKIYQNKGRLLMPVKPFTNSNNAKLLSKDENSYDIAEAGDINYHSAADELVLLASLQKVKQNTLAGINADKLKPMVFSSVDCPSDRRNGNHGFFAEFYISPDVAFKNMAYKNTGNINYSNRKDSTVTKRLSYTLGMRLTKEIGDNMVFKTGLQYSQINERFDYRNENERNSTTVVTIRTITNPDGSTTVVRDTSIVEQIGYRVKTTYNHYRSFDIPVLLGYEFAGEGWKASLNAGAIFNLSSWQEGEFLDTSYTPVSFAKSASSVFKKKTGVSLYAGLGFIKNIVDNTALFAEPYFRYSLSDRTAKTSLFTERFHVAGVLLGVRFKLSRDRAAK